jgi:hypothetical protein
MTSHGRRYFGLFGGTYASPTPVPSGPNFVLSTLRGGPGAGGLVLPVTHHCRGRKHGRIDIHSGQHRRSQRALV